MRCLTLSLLFLACAGPPFSATESGVSNGGDTTAGSASDSAGQTTSVGGVSGSTDTPTAGIPPTAGDGGEPGTSPDGGQSGDSTLGQGGSVPTVNCEGVLIWTLGCMSETPIETIVYHEQLWRPLYSITDCKPGCPPEGTRDESCQYGYYQYELIGPC